MASIKLLAAGLALVLVAGCSQPPQEPAPAPSVLLLVLDGLRADRVDGPVGSFRARFGPESVVFERAYTPSSLPQQSLASLFAGRLPTHGGGIGLAEAQPVAEATTLASALRGAGYRSALVSQAVWAGRPGYTRGFGDLQIAPEPGWSDRQVADKAIQVLEDWQSLDQKRADGSGRPSFLVVHWTTPRTQDGALGGEVSEAAYDAAIADRGVLIDGLLEDILGRVGLGDPVVVLTSGHGFELMEHGGVGSGWTLHEEAIRVPLLLRLPGAAARSEPAPVWWTPEMRRRCLEESTWRNEHAGSSRRSTRPRWYGWSGMVARRFARHRGAGFFTHSPLASRCPLRKRAASYCRPEPGESSSGRSA